MIMYRHGDVLLTKIDKLPENVKLVASKSKVILEGEVTGHAHKLDDNAKILKIAEEIANNATVGTALEQMQQSAKSQVIGYAVVDSPAELTHEEHKTITIPAGIFEIKRQREYDVNEIRFVQD